MSPYTLKYALLNTATGSSCDVDRHVSESRSSEVREIVDSVFNLIIFGTLILNKDSFVYLLSSLSLLMMSDWELEQRYPGQRTLDSLK